MWERPQRRLHRRIDIQMKVGLEVLSYPSYIRYIDSEKVGIRSPLEKGNVIRIPEGKEIIIIEEPIGSSRRAYVTIALEQKWDAENDEWLLIVAQSSDNPIKSRKFVRETVQFSVVLQTKENPKGYSADAVNLSGCGILVMLNRREEATLPPGTPVRVNFRLSSNSLDHVFNLIGGVVRTWQTKIGGLSRFMVGIHFDEQQILMAEQEAIIEYVLKSQLKRYAIGVQKQDAA